MVESSVKKIADVWVNVPARSINQAFSYYVPDDLEYLEAGWRVLVEFGSRIVEGFVLGLREINQGESEFKTILESLDSLPWFDENMLQTANWLCSHYLCTLTEALRLFIPGKSGIKTDTVYRLSQAADIDGSEILYYLAQKESVRASELMKKFGPAVRKKIYFLQKVIKKKITCKKSLEKACTYY
jgi:primosomal protein N' (replication factor Y)